MIECPKCGSSETSRVRNGKMRKTIALDSRLFRAHDCLTCGLVFLSVQKALTLSETVTLDSQISNALRTSGLLEPQKKQA